MSQQKIENVSRRRFLVNSAGITAGLTLGTYIAGCSRKQDQPTEAGPGAPAEKTAVDTPVELNAFVRIQPDSTVTVIMKHLEMGQGTYTGLATLVAEELDASWDQISVQGAPANAKLYNNLHWGAAQGTGGSTAIANSFMQMRKAGATARQMLVNAAAKNWQVHADEISVANGVVIHNAKGKTASFGELAEAAALEPVPANVFLKDPEEFRLIGARLPRKDTPDKVNGSATFTQDVNLPGMLTAVVAHPPRFGAKVKKFDAVAARAVKGVVEVVEIPNGVAVLGNGFWPAKQGRDALQIEWDEDAAFKLSSEEIMTQYKQLAQQEGNVARSEGDLVGARTNVARTLQTDFEFPYLAHAAMEPMNCVVKLEADGCEIWNGEQMQTGDQMAVANFLGLNPEQVTINMLYAGGSFGRRANPQSDYVVEAVSIAKASKRNAPVKLVWTREDDMRAGFYRPMYYHQVSAGLDKQGNLISWDHRIVGQSILGGSPFAGMVKENVDPTSVEGASNLPYAIPNIRVDLHSPSIPVPVQWWRSVGSTHTAFAVETVIDELAALAGKDPVEFRLTLLEKHPRHKVVLALAVEKAGWGQTMPAGRGRGVAVHESFDTRVAQVAEVTVHKDKTFSVDRVVIAVDCGIAVNPDVIAEQMEGGMGFGLAAALSSKITLKEGRVEQSNFHDYTVLRMNQMPDVEVHIVKSEQPPSGVGEPATPVIAPAVANALSAATGQRFRMLPLKLSA